MMSQNKNPFATSGSVSEEVKAFYDRYPYPRPVESLDAYRRRWDDLQRRRADFHLFWPGKFFQQEFSILVAGCGTSQAAKYALRWPEARVTGIDVSETSIYHTQQLKQKYNLDNLQVGQLPIERMGELGKAFDHIVCTGVLHHLPDPDAGLKALREVLKPDGAMHLMVYARYGRTGIYMMQEFCRRLGIHAHDMEISDLIAALKELPQGHPLEYLLRVAPDFQNPAELADALLHPQDRAYSVPEVFEFIHKAGLEFGRWIRQAPYDPHCGTMASIPQSPRISGLPLPEQYAAVELFRGTMVRHSLVVYQNSTPVQQVSFEGDAWLGYFPIRMSDTICIEERLPPGAAAVLINRNHTYRDLYMPINATEKLLLDAMDGNRSVADIIEKTWSSKPETSERNVARVFFERLWRYDQVVFDISRQTERNSARLDSH